MKEEPSIELGPIEKGVPVPNKDQALLETRGRVLLLNPGDSFEFRVRPIDDPNGRAYKEHGGYSYSRNAFNRLQA